MKYLVTGTAGFIGFYVSKKLITNGDEVIGIDNLNDYYDVNLKKSRLSQLQKFSNFTFIKIDLMDRKEIKKLFYQEKFDRVIHLAAQAGVRYSLEHPFAYVDSNITGFLSILEGCRENKVNHLIYASSSSVYGLNSNMPFKISDNVDNPISLYAATKASNELIANTYSHLFGLNTTGLRYFTVYGPWGRPDMAMFKFTKNIIENSPITVYNEGKMKRDFTYIDDIIKGTKSAIIKNYQCEIFNLGNNKSEELLNMIKIIENVVGVKAKINFQPIPPGDVKETFADIDRSKELLGYIPTVNIDSGIINFINWYKEYNKKI